MVILCKRDGMKTVTIFQVDWGRGEVQGIDLMEKEGGEKIIRE